MTRRCSASGPVERYLLAQLNRVAQETIAFCPDSPSGFAVPARSALSSTGSAAGVHPMFAVDFGKGHAPNIRAAF